MRGLALLFMGVVSVAVQAAETPDEAKLIARLEKLGANVKVDEDATGARLRVTFKKLDDQTSAQLRGLTQLLSLTIEDASRCTDKTLVVISTLTNLEELHLWRPSITNNGVATLKTLKNLRELTLSECRIGDAGLAVLKDHAKLETLECSGTLITNNLGLTLQTIPNLKSLGVSKTKFGDTGLLALKDAKNLKSVQATNTDISVKGAQALEKAVPGVRIRR